MGFIKNLQIQRSDYKYASQARTQAESLKQLSAGIYTEEERFVYELLQNAVDAFVDTKNKYLNIKIYIRGNILCFMHNGSAFSEKDIEGLCDVGNSNKADNGSSTNKKKVGYKGIGFKSVFMQSVDYVCVNSGGYCFKFDKEECAKLMPDFPDGELDADDTPWQIVPIPCSAPSGFNTAQYNVATYIKSNSIKNLSNKIKKLLENPLFLLFLNANNINIKFFKDSVKVITAGRETTNGEVRLICNDNIVSRWLVYTTKPIPVNFSIRKNLKNDFNTPPKLKEATEFEMSFAVSVNENGEVQEIEDSVLYSFLPTSYKNLGVPFLVNANFITDAGRQQLHQQSEWNRLIFGSIPKHFLEWISSFSSKHKDYYKILPSIRPKSSDELTDIYAESFKEALRKIAFIPSLSTGNLLKVNEAIYDSINFSNIAGVDSLVAHINKKNSSSFKRDSFFECADYQKFEEYGVYCFNVIKLKSYFEDVESIGSISYRRCIELIGYLHNLTEGSEEKTSLYSTLQDCKFLLCDDNTIRKPSECYFPTEYSENNSAYVSLIDSKVFDYIKSQLLFDWFKELGVKNLSLSNYLRDVYCKNNEKITTDNALEVGKIVYDAFVKGYLDEISERELKQLKFLTEKGSLLSANNLYLSKSYQPLIVLEGIIDDDVFISSTYIEYGDANIWKSIFIKKFGISESLDLSITRYEGSIVDIVDVPQNHRSELLAMEQGLKDKSCYVHRYGYDIEYYPAVLKCKDNDVLSKLFAEIFSKEYLVQDGSLYLDYRWSIDEHIRLRGDFWKHKISDFSLRGYILKYCQLYPSTSGQVHYASDVFLNTDVNNLLCGHYLPVLNITYQLSEDWLDVLPFKRDLSLEDLLLLLANIADDKNIENHERISLIYKRIVELGLQNSQTIKDWGKNHKILSSKNGEYYYPEDLSYITVEGFKNSNKAYIGKHDKSSREGLLQLLQTFGVKVITNEMIKPLFKNEVQSDELRDLLIKKLEFITLLKDDVKDQDSYNLVGRELLEKISMCNFYRCDEIALTYGNQNDVIEKKTFVRGNDIYYVGSLKPTIIEPLVTPLAKFLNLKNVTDELLIILITKDRNDLIDYVNDKGYTTEYIPVETMANAPHNEPIGETGTPEGSNSKSSTAGSASATQIANSSSTNGESTQSNYNQQREEYINKYSEKVKEFMGSDFSMPEDKVKSEHIITRYRILMFIKEYKKEFVIKSSFDEKSYIRTEGYAPIPLENGKQINTQGAKYGIWYLSPNVWHNIVDGGNYACLCVGNDELDFKMILNENDIKDLAESTKNVFMRMTPTATMNIMDTIKSVMNPNTTILSDDIQLRTIYSNRDVHIMLLVHPTPNPVLNSMFDNVFKSEGGDFNID